MVVNNYMLIFKGKVLDGYCVEEVKKNLAGLLDKEQSMIEFLFSGRRCVIKSSRGLKAVMQYQGLLALTGALAEIECRPLTRQEPRREASDGVQSTILIH